MTHTDEGKPPMTAAPITPESSRTPASPPPVSLGSMPDFVGRHIGPSDADARQMLASIGLGSLDELAWGTVPDTIRVDRPPALSGAAGAGLDERGVLAHLRSIAEKNTVNRSCIGTGYHGTVLPEVIKRNVLENPGWYTQYTPYQAELAQGRLEALLNFQTMVVDLTGLELAGASLLDEATAAAEAMAMCFAISKGNRTKFFVASDCHPQTIDVVKTRAGAVDIEIVVGDPKTAELDDTFAGVLVQYPTTDGRVECYTDVIEKAHAAGALVVFAADLMALTLLKPPGEFGADIAVGSAQRFGVPMGFGGPHAAYISTHIKHARKMPGRIIGLSQDAHGNPALRMAIQTREQHIKRDRATSNICTAQALLAIIAGFYGSYHGPDGLKAIATRIRTLTQALRAGLLADGHTIGEDLVFDTLHVTPTTPTSGEIVKAALARGINIRDFGDGTVGVTLDETSDETLVADLLSAFGAGETDVAALIEGAALDIPPVFARTSAFMTHPVFNSYRCETDMLRYLKKLENRDLSLAHSMIPLGSCTMKLNASSEMAPVTWPEFGDLHPFAPSEQTKGYQELLRDLESWLGSITGLPAVCLQPNAGAQGELTGLLVIRAHHEAHGQGDRNVCLIPTSAHGTNPASAVMAGMNVVAVACDSHGNIDVGDLRAKAEQHAGKLAAFMVTYPSTHGVFEGSISEMNSIVHEHGGQVYMDGANLNAQLGLTSPAACGADVCHLNLHKTFCIPHGGGGPGMGPIAVGEHLARFLPGHAVSAPGSAGKNAIGAVSAAAYGSPSILPISWMYIALMGSSGLTKASLVAILSANYMAKRLEGHYDIVYTGESGRVAHEFIVECRPFEKSAGVKIDDIAKRLIDYGFHAPTMSFPVPGTLMIEPTESEPLGELDRFCDAMIAIRAEIREIEGGTLDRDDNMLKHSPHTIGAVSADEWTHGYSRERAAFPAPWLRDAKFWAHVGRVDNPYGDRNLICTCPSVDELSD